MTRTGAQAQAPQAHFEGAPFLDGRRRRRHKGEGAVLGAGNGRQRRRRTAFFSRAPKAKAQRRRHSKARPALLTTQTKFAVLYFNLHFFYFLIYQMRLEIAKE